jgi:hypothetical protein
MELKKSKRSGLALKRVKVIMTGSDETIIIVFVKGYNEHEESLLKGKRKQKEPKWAAFLSTNTCLQLTTIIKKYTKCWAWEVFFEVSKQLLSPGKHASNSLQSQVCATTISVIRYALINYLKLKPTFSLFLTLQLNKSAYLH